MQQPLAEPCQEGDQRWCALEEWRLKHVCACFESKAGVSSCTTPHTAINHISLNYSHKQTRKMWPRRMQSRSKTQ